MRDDKTRHPRVGRDDGSWFRVARFVANVALSHSRLLPRSCVHSSVKVARRYVAEFAEFAKGRSGVIERHILVRPHHVPTQRIRSEALLIRRSNLTMNYATSDPLRPSRSLRPIFFKTSISPQRCVDLCLTALTGMVASGFIMIYTDW